MMRITRSRYAVASVLAAAALVAGCGSSGKPAVGAATTSPTTASQAAAGGSCSGNISTLRLSVGAGPDSGIVQLASDQGFFQQNCLNITETRTSSPAVSLAALVGGSADVAFAPTVVLDNAIAKGLSLEAFAPSEGFSAAAASGPASSYDGTGVYVPPGSGVTSIAQLTQSTVAVPARQAQQEIGTALLIKQAGADPSGVKWVQLDFPTAVQQLLAGNIQAATLIPPFTSKAALAGAKLIGSPTLALYGPDCTYVMWYATAATVKAKTVALKEYRKAITEAEQMAMTNKTAFLQALSKSTNTPINVLTTDHSQVYYATALKTTDLTHPAQVMVQLGYLKSAPDLSNVIVSWAK